MILINSICPACRKMFLDKQAKLKLFRRSRYQHHNPPYLLKQAADSGCFICVRVWRQLSEDERALILSTRWWTMYLCRYNQDFLGLFGTPSLGAYSCEIDEFCQLKFAFGIDAWKEIIFNLHHADDPVRIDGHVWYDISQLSVREYMDNVQLNVSTRSEQTWSTIQYWWDTSMIRGGIKLTSDSSNLFPGSELAPPRIQWPSRLLDLGDVSLGPDVRLVLPGTDVRQGYYMTLSYRWRPDKDRPFNTCHWPWELTKMSMDQMRTRISLGRLPQTFQDAITIVRRLKIRYLWIDAMCIIQDDVADWQLESSRMGLIYQHAICNIAAGSGSVEASLFRTRNPQMVLPLRLDVDLIRQGHRLSGSMYVVERKYREHHLSRSCLDGRGWIVQERILSPRILHFLSDQVLWEEDLNSACEVFPFGCVQLANERDHGKPRTSSVIDAYSSSSMSRSIWDDLVRIYSATLLTRRDDRMKALQGLAQHWLSCMSGDRYCAGMWETTMPQCLLWKVAGGRDYEMNAHLNSDASHPPSWSWMSVSTKVEPYYHTMSGLEEGGYQATILEFNLSPENPECPLGDLKPGATILIRGRLISAKGMYWPLSSLNRSFGTADRSSIEACRSPLGYHRLECSIDNIPSFLAMWGNTAPSTPQFDHRVRWAFYHLIYPCLTVLGIYMSAAAQIRRLALIGVLLACLALPLRLATWHFTNFGSKPIYFLEICSGSMIRPSEGLVLLKQEDGTYRRLGVFNEGYIRRKLFVDVKEQDVVLV